MYVFHEFLVENIKVIFFIDSKKCEKIKIIVHSSILCVIELHVNEILDCAFLQPINVSKSNNKSHCMTNINDNYIAFIKDVIVKAMATI